MRLEKTRNLSRRVRYTSHPQRLTNLVDDAAHLHVAQTHQQLTHACRVNIHRDPPVSRLLICPILEDLPRSAADPHRADSTLKREEPQNHALLVKELKPAIGRFKQLDDDDQTAFRDRLGAFVRLYTFLSQILPYADSDLEKLAAFARALLPNLRDDDNGPLSIEDYVEMEFYRLQYVSTGIIELDDETTTVKSPTATGTGRSDEDEAPLSEIITNLNDRFGTEFNETDRLFLEQLHQDGTNDENISQTARANPLDKFDLAVRQDLLKLMIQRIDSNGDLVKRCSNEPDFGEIVLAGLAKAIHETVTQDSER